MIRSARAQRRVEKLLGERRPPPSRFASLKSRLIAIGAPRHRGDLPTYAWWCDVVGQLAAIYDRRLAFGPTFFDAWMAGVTPTQFIRRAPRCRR